MASQRSLRTLVSTAVSASTSASKPSLRCSHPARALSTATPSRAPQSQLRYQDERESGDRPRWQQTPPRMTAPFRVRPLPKGPEFHVNEDPKRLDDVYIRLLGSGGEQVLTDEVKWLAVTHKSFDHARRGCNDRLAFLGRRIVSLQTSQALLDAPQPTAEWSLDSTGRPQPDQYGRVPFVHAALNGLAGLSGEAQDRVLDKSRLSNLAVRYGLDKVTRWKPKRTDDLQGSGLESVLMTSLYAIVGAISLERGGEEANKFVQNKILTPLGFTFTTD